LGGISEGKMPRRERATGEGDEMARPADWIGMTVIMGTAMHGDDTVGTLEEVNDRGVVVRHGIVEVESEVVEFEADAEGEVVEIESEIEGEPERQSVFYPWTKINWMYHPEE
jgi:hypothetical protein